MQPDPSIDEAAAVAMRPTEAQCIAAGVTAGIPEETTRRWLDYMRKCDWHFTSGGIVTRANFRTSLIKWWSREKREAEEAKAKSSESSQTRRRYMTWQERAAEEREEAERKQKQRLLEIYNSVLMK